MKKQGKRSKNKHLSEEAFKKIRYNQDMWRVYKRTGKDTDCEVYKQAHNAATSVPETKFIGTEGGGWGS